MSFLDIVSKFNQQADSHSKSQSLNPFSEQFEHSRSPSPRFSREEYGKPIAGSKTDLRGRKAKSHICREILELCTVIHDVGTYNSKKKDPDDDGDDGDDDGTIIVSFGELFQIYTKISDKVVGLLIAAKRRGFVYFDREILFQRRDDDVLIALLKPISEISKILKDDISQTNAPTAPVEPQPVEKTKTTSCGKTKRVKPETERRDDNTAAVNDDVQTNGVSEINAAVVTFETDQNCNKEMNGRCVDDEGVINNVIDISENIQDDDDDSIRVDTSAVGDVSYGVDVTADSDDVKTEQTEEISSETKTDEISDETKTDEMNADETKTDGTDTREFDGINIERTDELTDDGLVASKSENCDLASGGGKVPGKEIENDRNETAPVEVDENSAKNDVRVDTVRKQCVEEVSMNELDDVVDNGNECECIE